MASRPRSMGSVWRVAFLTVLGATTLLATAPAIAPPGPASLIAAPAAIPPDAPVADAARRGDLEAVRALLREGADVNAAQGDGMTALHWAALDGHADMARVLVYAGANLEATTRLGAYTPLHLASRDGQSASVAVLLESGARADASTATGATALHFAAAAGDVASLGALIEHGAELNARELAHGQTPLMWAAADGRLEAVDALIAAGADLGVTTTVVDFSERAKQESEARGRRQDVMAAIRKAELQARGEWVEDEDSGGATITDTPSGQAPTRREAQDRAQRDQTQGAGATPAETAAGQQPPAEGEKAEEKGAEEEKAEGEAPQAEKAPEAETPAETAEEKPAEDEEEPAAETKSETAPAPELEPLSYADLVGRQGGLTALHYAVRQGHFETVKALLAAGAGIDEPTGGDRSTPLVLALVNGHYDMAAYLLEQGANPDLASEDGVTPLYATIANRWAPKALYPQPTAFRQQQLSYLDLMEDLLERGADPNARVKTHIWYSAYNFDLLGVDFMGATPFWRAAKALDIPAMRLLVANGAGPHIPTQKPPERRRRRPADEDEEEEEDPSGLPPVEVGGPGIPPLVAAAGYGYGRSRTGNQHRYAPHSWLPTAKYLIEELGADPNARDHEGFGALHFAAARGDNELIEYLVSKGGDPMIVARTGQTTVDMANGPIQRVQPFFETIALLEGMGAVNNNNCQSC